MTIIFNILNVKTYHYLFLFVQSSSLRKLSRQPRQVSRCARAIDVLPIGSAVTSYYFRYGFYPVRIPTVNHDRTGFLQRGESPQLRNANNAPIFSDIRLAALWENRAGARVKSAASGEILRRYGAQKSTYYLRS